MSTDLGDKEMRGITWKVFLSILGFTVMVITTFEVGYSKLLNQMQIMQLNIESERRVDRLEKDAQDKRIYNLEAEVLQIRNDVYTNKADIDKYHPVKK